MHAVIHDLITPTKKWSATTSHFHCRIAGKESKSNRGQQSDSVAEHYCASMIDSWTLQAPLYLHTNSCHAPVVLYENKCTVPVHTFDLRSSGECRNAGVFSYTLLLSWSHIKVYYSKFSSYQSRSQIHDSNDLYHDDFSDPINDFVFNLCPCLRLFLDNERLPRSHSPFSLSFASVSFISVFLTKSSGNFRFMFGVLARACRCSWLIPDALIIVLIKIVLCVKIKVTCVHISDTCSSQSKR